MDDTLLHLFFYHNFGSCYPRQRLWRMKKCSRLIDLAKYVCKISEGDRNLDWNENLFALGVFDQFAEFDRLIFLA